jgi:hypothetical protein
VSSTVRKKYKELYFEYKTLRFIWLGSASNERLSFFKTASLRARSLTVKAVTEQSRNNTCYRLLSHHFYNVIEEAKLIEAEMFASNWKTISSWSARGKTYISGGRLPH